MSATVRLHADASVVGSEWKSRLYSWKTIVMCTVPLLAFGLGTWQVRRLKWKLALLDEVNDRMHRRPIALPLRVTSDEISQNEYRRVIVYGVFDYNKEMLVGPRSLEGEPGYILVTPLVREDGSRILVSRGWIRRELKDPKSRPLSQPADSVTVVAFVRRATGKNKFTPESSPENNEWYSLDLDLMSKHADTQQVLLEVIQPESTTAAIHDARNGVPIGVPFQVDIRNNHLQYLITWYALAVITSGMLFYTLRKPESAAAKIRRLRSKAGRIL
ncbi:surf-like protein [Coemansia sp. RSA 1358]|uniref:SURF1-like protein n=1 Tax=Coemansia umbellata TaxID=1424467 RepID=A0ABQ8PJG9_9FUNG|nr:surf-like protein [Coemansia umbellata]KAJ2620264.1 surf-like protein [Coemansia sp. RSA 1358]